MTKEQYDQWCDFALRMAQTLYGAHRRPSGSWVTARAQELLDGYAESYEHVDNWDQTRNREELPCDAMMGLVDDWMPGFHGRLLDDAEERCADDDAEFDEDAVLARITKAQRQWESQYMGPVACCVRAGLDMATEIGGGVVGFVVGDIRRMYPEGIPDFVSRHYANDLEAASEGAAVWL